MRSVVAYYNWTGFYVGINAGYGLGTSNWELLPRISIKPKGSLVGGTLGYNYRPARSSTASRATSTGPASRTASPARAVVTCETKNNWLATFRGRVGYAFDRWLPYLTGGGAFGNVKATTTLHPGVAASASSRPVGWTVGGGLEYAFLGNWTRQDRISLRRSRQLRRRHRPGREQRQLHARTSFAPA